MKIYEKLVVGTTDIFNGYVHPVRVVVIFLIASAQELCKLNIDLKTEPKLSWKNFYFSKF